MSFIFGNNSKNLILNFLIWRKNFDPKAIILYKSKKSYCLLPIKPTVEQLVVLMKLFFVV